MRRVALAVALLLALLAAAAAGWFVAGSRYGAAVGDREAQLRQLNEAIRQKDAALAEQQQKIAELSARLGDEQKEIERLKTAPRAAEAKPASAPPDNTAATIDKLKSELEAAKKQAEHPPHLPNVLYQNGKPVGVVRGANPDERDRSLTFSAITAPGEIALPGEFEFLQWRLRCEDSGLKATTTLGAQRELNYYRVQCRML